MNLKDTGIAVAIGMLIGAACTYSFVTVENRLAIVRASAIADTIKVLAPTCLEPFQKESVKK